MLSARADLDTLVTAVEKCREIGAAPALQEWGARELYPGPGTDLEAWVRRTAITYHHQVGTCRMGSDVMAVVDPELRVHGIEGLRVADASIMPTVITGNTNAPSLMIGERVADFVLGARPASRRGRHHGLMAVLVTGGTGVIGAHVVRQLLAAGEDVVRDERERQPLAARAGRRTGACARRALAP